MKSSAFCALTACARGAGGRSAFCLLSLLPSLLLPSSLLLHHLPPRSQRGRAEQGGALAKLLPIFSLGGGGVIGSGKQAREHAARAVTASLAQSLARAQRARESTHGVLEKRKFVLY